MALLDAARESSRRGATVDVSDHFASASLSDWSDEDSDKRPISPLPQEVP